jgi:hypothetical protein
VRHKPVGAREVRGRGREGNAVFEVDAPDSDWFEHVFIFSSHIIASFPFSELYLKCHFVKDYNITFLSLQDIIFVPAESAAKRRVLFSSHFQ